MLKDWKKNIEKTKNRNEKQDMYKRINYKMSLIFFKCTTFFLGIIGLIVVFAIILCILGI